MEKRITVANYTLSLSFDCEGCPGGTLVRMPDGVEARFSSPDCLLHLLEGMVGRRVFQLYHDQLVAQIAQLAGCA